MTATVKNARAARRRGRATPPRRRGERPPAPTPAIVDLYLLGTGIGGFHQITRETAETLRRARVIFNLAGEQDALHRLNPDVRDLEALYWSGDEYWTVYERIVAEVLQELERGPGVALVSYGHPLVFDNVSHQLVRRSRRRGYRVVVLPAVSCLDTICIELGITYGEGLQIFELDHVFERRFKPNPAFDALILDVGHVGLDGTVAQPPDAPGRVRPLVERLLEFYPADHKATLVFCGDGAEASRLTRSQIGSLDRRRRELVPGITLYIPGR